jgi:hypothetical protein
VFVKRANNNAAHECAAYVRLVGVGGIWNGVFPDSVTKAMALDCK